MAKSLWRCSAVRVETLLTHWDLLSCSVVFFRLAGTLVPEAKAQSLWGSGEPQGGLTVECSRPCSPRALLRALLHHQLFSLPSLRLLMLAGLEDLIQASRAGKFHSWLAGLVIPGVAFLFNSLACFSTEFKKTDKSILVSPEGPSRVAFNPEQKPRHGVLKSTTVTPAKEPQVKRPFTMAAKKRPTAVDFF